MFKTMGYSPGFLLKNIRCSTLSNFPEIDTNSRAKSQKSFQKGLGGISESLERFPGLAQIRHVQNHGLQPRVFAQNLPNFDPLEFSRNRNKQSRKELEIILEQFRRHFREFGAISRTCPNPPCSKPWAIAQAFCSKTFDFRPSRMFPKSTQTVAQRVRNHFRRVQQAFQRVWSDFQDLPKSAMFKTMGYSPGFLLKYVLHVLETFQKGFGGISESLERFPGLAQIRHFQNNGQKTRVFGQKRPNFDPLEFSRNRNKQSRNELEIILEQFRRHFREFGAISRTCPNPPCSKPWAIAQAFCSKTFDFRPSRMFPKSTQTVAQRVRNHFRRVQQAFQRVWSDFQDLPKSAMFKTMGYSPGFLLKYVLHVVETFQKGFGGISESLERFPGLAQIRHFQNHGQKTRVFGQKRPNFDPLKFSRNRHKQSRKELGIILEQFRRHFREFGAISRTSPNPPCSKPWAIAQAFCSKTFDFRPSRIFPKSTQTVAQ